MKLGPIYITRCTTAQHHADRIAAALAVHEDKVKTSGTVSVGNTCRMLHQSLADAALAMGVTPTGGVVIKPPQPQ